MVLKIKNVLTARLAYLVGGVAAVAVVFVLTWLNLASSVNLRRPSPSLDGDYFAYFDRVDAGFGGSGEVHELIISTPEGRMVARYPMDPGEISWSNAGHLVVMRQKQSLATLVANAGGTFIVLTSLALSPGAEPRWARSGTKLGFVRSGAAGPEIAVYDLLQTQATTVPLADDIHLSHPVLLFWSPGGQELYFLNGEGKETILYKSEVISGGVEVMARSGSSGWGGPPLRDLPEMSPDGTRIYLPRPLNSVIDAESGETQWSLPAEGTALWSPWSADGARLFYWRTGTPARIYAHEFSTGEERVLFSDQPISAGFFSEDGGSYFYRTRSRPIPGTYWSRLQVWLAGDWGWRHVDSVTQIARPLERAELWPWEITRNGLILMSRDDYSRVRYGLYDPNARFLSVFHFPTGRDDVSRQARSHAMVLLAIALYGILGFFVFLARPSSAPARALYFLSLVLMVLFASLDTARSLFSVYGQWGTEPARLRFTALEWEPLIPRAFLMQNQIFIFLVALALVPPALVRFAVVFPEGNRFLGPRKALQIPLYAVALLPVAGILAALTSFHVPEAIRSWVGGLTLIGGGVAMGTAFLALFYNFRHPPDRRARDQVRWVALAFSLPVVGASILFAAARLGELVGPHLGRNGQHMLEVLSTAGLSLLCLFTPLAIGYALLAHKLFDIQLLFRRTVRYSFLTSLVVMVYLLMVGGLSWAIAGSLGNPPKFVMIISTLLTAVILAPARRSLVRFFDRTFTPNEYSIHETLQSIAEGLVNILDRQTLASVTSRTVRAAMKTRTFYFFVLDRQAKKLRPMRTERETQQPAGGLEFDPGELLCRYLVAHDRPFEVEVSPYDQKLIPIFQSAAERLSKLQAAVIFPLVRRGELVGLMVLGRKASEEFYNTEDLALLQTVARQAALAIENAELFAEVTHGHEMRKEMEIADEVQAQLFPSVIPPTAGCQIAGRSVPAHSLSGDYYDFLELPGQKIGLAIGDVSGKGASASRLMANLQSLLRSQAASAESLEGLVRRINRQLFASSRGAKYCTFFYAVYSEHGRRLEFINASHNSPLLVSPKGVRLLESTGVPLGLFAEASHEVREVVLEQGSTVILYSDGVTEARDGQGRIFGVDRLVASAQRVRNLDAPAMVEGILNDVREFTRGAPNQDDRTLVLLKVAAA